MQCQVATIRSDLNERISVVLLLRRRPAGLQHALRISCQHLTFPSHLRTLSHLSHLKLDARNGLAIGDSKVGRQRGMPDDGCERVAVLVRQPLTFGSQP